MAEGSCSGLQSRLCRFESDSRLHDSMRLLRAALICAVAASAALAPAESWARHGGGRGHFHHHGHPHGVLLLGFFPWPYHAYPPPYYYGPDFGYEHSAPPTVYVEKFPGAPTPETPGEFFCPDQGVFYPDVKDCAGGWQRVIRPPQG